MVNITDSRRTVCIYTIYISYVYTLHNMLSFYILVCYTIHICSLTSYISALNNNTNIITITVSN